MNICRKGVSVNSACPVVTGSKQNCIFKTLVCSRFFKKNQPNIKISCSIIMMTIAFLMLRYLGYLIKMSLFLLF